MCVSTDDLSDDLLRLIDLEVTRMKQYADDNREMLEKVARRQHLWMEFLQHEVSLVLSFDNSRLRCVFRRMYSVMYHWCCPDP